MGLYLILGRVENLGGLSRYLTTAGHELLVAKNLTEATRLLAGRPVEGVILGLDPRAGGWERTVSALLDPASAGQPVRRTADDEAQRFALAGLTLEQAERLLVTEALERAGWIQRRAAELLGVSRRSLNYKIKKLGLTHPRWTVNKPEGD